MCWHIRFIRDLSLAEDFVLVPWGRHNTGRGVNPCKDGIKKKEPRRGERVKII